MSVNGQSLGGVAVATSTLPFTGVSLWMFAIIAIGVMLVAFAIIRWAKRGEQL